MSEVLEVNWRVIILFEKFHVLCKYGGSGVDPVIRVHAVFCRVRDAVIHQNGNPEIIGRFAPWGEGMKKVEGQEAVEAKAGHSLISVKPLFLFEQGINQVKILTFPFFPSVIFNEPEGVFAQAITQGFVPC